MALMVTVKLLSGVRYGGAFPISRDLGGTPVTGQDSTVRSKPTIT